MPSSTSSARPHFEEFGRRVDQQVAGAMPRVEEEVKKVITYLNDEVVPEVRRNSSRALRLAAEQLSRLAERLDERRQS